MFRDRSRVSILAARIAEQTELLTRGITLEEYDDFESDSFYSDSETELGVIYDNVRNLYLSL